MSAKFELIQKNITTRFSNWRKEEFKTEILSRSLNAGFFLFLLESILVISFSALIFRGRIEEFLPLALTYVLVGDAILVTTISILSSNPGTIAVEQDTPAVILAIAIAGMVALFPASASSETLFATVLVLLLGMTLISGAVFLLIGIFKWGGLVRFLPYPVLGGFLAGTGWLLATGGIDIMYPISSTSGWLMSENVIFWLPGLIGGAIMLAAKLKWSNPIILSVCTIVLLLGFYLVVLIFQVPFEVLSEQGWLLGPFPEVQSWSFPISAERLSFVDWNFLLQALPTALPAVIIALIALLLNISSLEVLVKRDLDVNREMVSAGVANIASFIGGGLIGYHTISLSALNQSLSKGKRLPGIMVGLLLMLVAVVGVQALSFVPRIVLGALLIYLGLDLLYEWVVEVWKKFPKVDAVIVMVILGTIVYKDFLWGIGVGMILTVVMFVVSYSRIDNIRYIVSGTTYRSRFNRDMDQTRILQMHGDEFHIIKLDGFIFFGTANSIYEKVKGIMKVDSFKPIRYIILDFAMVSGLDSTGLLSFEKLIQFLREKNVTLIFSSLSGRTRSQFEKGGFAQDKEGLMVMDSLDRAIEWCETKVIAHNSSTFSSNPNLSSRLSRIVSSKEALTNLIGFMDKREYEKGDFLIKSGDQPDEMLFIESGQVTVQIYTDQGVPIRLETTTGGRVVGELGFYLSVPRTADVIADEQTCAYVLNHEMIDQMKNEDPEALHALSEVIIHQTSDRIVTMTRVVDALRK